MQPGDLHKDARAESIPVRSIVTKQVPRQIGNFTDAAAVRERASAGDQAEAARLALEAYGAEIFGFLISALDDAGVARALYADVRQRVRTEIEGFGWGCSLRLWIYSLARRELRERRLRRQKVSEGITVGGAASVMETESRREAGVTEAIAAVRRTLSEEDRELLILRIDRALDWSDVAVTELGENASALAVSAESVALKARLVELLAHVERLTLEHVRVR